MSNTQPQKFRKKPVEIEAMLYDGENDRQINQWSTRVLHKHPDGPLEIHTLEGTMTADIGDWIIKGVQGEFYPCKPEIFEATYEAVTTHA